MKPVVQEVRCQKVAAALAAGEVVELVVKGHLNKHNSFDYYIKYHFFTEKKKVLLSYFYVEGSSINDVIVLEVEWVPDENSFRIVKSKTSKKAEFDHKL